MLDRTRKGEHDLERPLRAAPPTPEPGAEDLHPLLALQATAGNAAVARFMRGRAAHGAAERRIARVTDAAVLERANQLRAAKGMPPLPALEAPAGAEQQSARDELTHIEGKGGDQAAATRAHHKLRVEAAFVAEVTARPVPGGWSADTLRTLADYGTQLQPVTSGNANSFSTLASFIGGALGGTNAHARRAQVLIAYNTRFSKTDVRLPAGVQPPQWARFEEIVMALDGPLAGLTTVTTIPIGDIITKLGAVAGNDVHKGLGVLDAAKGVGNLGVVSAARMPRMIELYDAFPPATPFAGAPEWGQGDHPDVATNKYQHFIKHVIHGFDPDHGTEREALWNVLALRLREQDVVANLPGGAPATAIAEIRTAFGDDAGSPVSELTVANKAALKRLSDLVLVIPHVGRALYALMGSTYLNHFLALSLNLKNTALCFAGADHQFISGWEGNQYVHCRLYGTDAKISSGYWVPNPAVKFGSQKEQRLWLL